MAANYLALFAIAAVVTQGLTLALPESRNIVHITLPDQFHTFITNPLIGKSLGIPKSFLDTLEACYVVFPNGGNVEAFPNNRLPNGPITFLHAAQPFTSCAIGFLAADVSLSGTYELISVVHHTSANYRSSTRQRFHLTLVQSSSL